MYKISKKDCGKSVLKDELNSYEESPWGKTFREQKLGLEFERMSLMKLINFVMN